MSIQYEMIPPNAAPGTTVEVALIGVPAGESPTVDISTTVPGGGTRRELVIARGDRVRGGRSQRVFTFVVPPANLISVLTINCGTDTASVPL